MKWELFTPQWLAPDTATAAQVKPDRSKKMKIRIAGIDDAKATLAFLTKFRREDLNTVLRHDGIPSLDSQSDFIANLDRNKGVMILAETDDGIVGSLTAERKGHPQLSHSCEFGIGILDSYRGKGIGTQMIDRMFDWAIEFGITRIELSVFDNNEEAIRLYKRIGFVDEGRKIGAVMVDGVPVDIVEMAKVIERSSETE